MSERPSTFDEIIHLEQHGPDTWVGLSPNYPMPRVYGGQVVSQALWAALQTVDEGFRPHSLHAYFIRGGDKNEPIRYEVDRLRNGRSFCTRATVARQSGGAILNLSASFHRDEVDADVQEVRMPLVADPDEIRPFDSSWGIMERRSVRTYPGAGKSMGWVRLKDPVADDPRAHVCGLAFTSDTFQFGAARSLHPKQVPIEEHHSAFMGASLDHAIWFHRPMKADEWHLYEWECRGLRGARGMTVGNLFNADGEHVASVAQEVLLRENKPK